MLDFNFLLAALFYSCLSCCHRFFLEIGGDLRCRFARLPTSWVCPPTPVPGADLAALGQHLGRVLWVRQLSPEPSWLVNQPALEEAACSLIQKSSLI